MPRPRSAVYRMSNTAATGPGPPSAINHHYASIYKRIRATWEIAPSRAALCRDELCRVSILLSPCQSRASSVREISGNISNGEGRQRRSSSPKHADAFPVRQLNILLSSSCAHNGRVNFTTWKMKLPQPSVLQIYEST